MSYLSEYLNGKTLKRLCTSSKSIIKDIDFDTIAVRGNSGLLVGSLLAMEMEKDLIIVRKDGEKSHATFSVEGWGQRQNILIVDDFIESGETIDIMYEKIMNNCDSPKIVGAYLYAATSNRTIYCSKVGNLDIEMKLWSLTRSSLWS